MDSFAYLSKHLSVPIPPPVEPLDSPLSLVDFVDLLIHDPSESLPDHGSIYPLAHDFESLSEFGGMFPCHISPVHALYFHGLAPDSFVEILF